MFEALSDKLQGVFRKLGNRGVITERDLDEAMREVRIALLEADVNFKVVRQFIAQVRERALGAEVLRSLTPTQQIIGIVHQALVETLGGERADLGRSPSHPPTLVMLVGLQGSGKTTSAAKLGVYLRGKGERPLLVAADVYRPAAVEQLVTLGQQNGLEVYQEGTGARPADIVAHALERARRGGFTYVLVDTAGRLHVDQEMMAEVADLRQRFNPTEVLFVADAMAGQDAVRAAEEFHQAVGTTGLILTKMDGDARGGAALSIRQVVGVPVKFIGVGERANALEPFYPDRLASRILGMGDVVSLVEKAQETIDQREAQKLAEKMKKGSFDLEDFLDQMQRVKRMGPLGQLMQMVPGMGALRGKLDFDQLESDHFKKIEAIIYSMTPRERRHPEIIDGSRRRRIARGSGTTPQDVNQLLNQFREARKMMKVLAGPRGRGGFPLFR
ncbi:MAG TPA: signal recognition particle protein [Dehalococcoidia bacterium]